METKHAFTRNYTGKMQAVVLEVEESKDESTNMTRPNENKNVFPVTG
jgi:hypothetical protein